MKYYKYLIFFLLLLLSFFAINSFFTPGFFDVHDNTQTERVYEMGKALKDGMIPIRWVMDLGYGYGYPIFNFYAPLAYYFGGFFILLGASSLLATKIMMVFGVILSAFMMFILGKEFWGIKGGIVSALFYLYAPYHALQIYVRGDVAESWAYSFVPFLFYSIFKVFESKKLRYSLLTAFSFALIILSHNLTALMVTPFAVLFALILIAVSKKKKEVFPCYLFGLIVGLLVSAFYWLPVLTEMGYTNVMSQIGGGSDFRDHFACLPQLWNSYWGFGGSAPGCIDGISLKIGKLHVGISVVSIVLFLTYFLRKGRKRGIHFWAVILGFIGAVFSAFLTLSVSRPFWETISLMEFFQFPWRFLLLISFFTSFIAGSIIWLMEKLEKKRFMSLVTALIIILLLIIPNKKLFAPQFIKSISENVSEEQIRWETSKISDEYLPKDFEKPNLEQDVAKERLIVPKGVDLKMEINKTHRIKASVLTDQFATLKVNIAYFPGWKAFIDGEEVPIEKSRTGFELTIPEGKHTLEIKYVQTDIEIVSNYLFLTGIVIAVIAIIYFKKKKKII